MYVNMNKVLRESCPLHCNTHSLISYFASWLLRFAAVSRAIVTWFCDYLNKHQSVAVRFVPWQRFTSKQDVIRHYNMHKKRDNSLQHGFMRFSPLDDCSVYYHGCHLNGKSTHYHCMQVNTHAHIHSYTHTKHARTLERYAACLARTTSSWFGFHWGWNPGLLLC